MFYNKAIYMGVFLVSFGLLMAGCFNDSKITSPSISFTDDETNDSTEFVTPDREAIVADEQLVLPDDAEHYSKIPTVKQAGADNLSEEDDADMENRETGDPVQPSDASGKTVQPPFDPSHPALMGLRVNDSRKTVTARYGEPDNLLEMMGPSDSLEVFQYSGFTVGFNDSKQIVFIDVDSGEVNPGLNGIRIGSGADEVISALGKPFSDTEYVISYKGAGMVLKLDMDPKLHKVTSIKLFASE